MSPRLPSTGHRRLCTFLSTSDFTETPRQSGDLSSASRKSRRRRSGCGQQSLQGSGLWVDPWRGELTPPKPAPRAAATDCCTLARNSTVSEFRSLKSVSLASGSRRLQGRAAPRCCKGQSVPCLAQHLGAAGIRWSVVTLPRACSHTASRCVRVCVHTRVRAC